MTRELDDIMKVLKRQQIKNRIVEVLLAVISITGIILIGTGI